MQEYTGKEDMLGLRSDKLPGHLKKLKILLLEDDAINRMVIRQFLQYWQLDFKEATNGKEAISMAGKQLFDLITSRDLRTPILEVRPPSPFYTKFEPFINNKSTETFRCQHITGFFQKSLHPTECVGHQCNRATGPGHARDSAGYFKNCI